MASIDPKLSSSATSKKQRRGGRYCVAGGANGVSCNNSQFTEGISMHAFPSAGNPERERMRRRWTVFVKRHRPDFQPSSSSHLCSAHFEQSAFTTNLNISVDIGMKRRLKPGAVPTIDVAGVMASPESTQQPTDREKRQVRS